MEKEQWKQSAVNFRRRDTRPSQAAYDAMRNAKKAMEDYVPPSVNEDQVLVNH